jgi:hypothetical protein
MDTDKKKHPQIKRIFADLNFWKFICVNRRNLRIKSSNPWPSVFIRGQILVLRLKKVRTKEKRPDTTPASIENKRSKNFLFNAA